MKESDILSSLNQANIDLDKFIFADWLEEQGKPTSANIVRDSVAYVSTSCNAKGNHIFWTLFDHNDKGLSLKYQVGSNSIIFAHLDNDFMNKKADLIKNLTNEGHKRYRKRNK